MKIILEIGDMCILHTSTNISCWDSEIATSYSGNYLPSDKIYTVVILDKFYFCDWIEWRYWCLITDNSTEETTCSWIREGAFCYYESKTDNLGITHLVVV